MSRFVSKHNVALAVIACASVGIGLIATSRAEQSDAAASWHSFDQPPHSVAIGSG
jgi:hypothetical protein